MISVNNVNKFLPKETCVQLFKNPMIKSSFYFRVHLLQPIITIAILKSVYYRFKIFFTSNGKLVAVMRR